jgi:hypothetical protein
MSNFTLPYSTSNCAVTDPQGKTMQEKQEMTREELQTLQILDTLQYAPRTSTLVAIFEHARNVQEEQR